MTFFKNKRSSFILIPLLLLVWGYLVFKIYILTVGIKTVEPERAKTKRITKISNPIKEKLSFGYRDPFLSGFGESYQLSDDAPEPIYTPPMKSNNKLLYLGRVTSNNSGLIYFNFKVDNEYLLLQKGERKNGLEIISIYTDSVKVLYNNEITFLKLY